MDKKQTRLSHNCLCCCCYPHKYQFHFNRHFYVVRNARKTHGDTTIRFLDKLPLVNYDLHQFQSNVIFASFVALWIASTLLLRRQRRKWGAIKFYIVISGPLLYYLGVIQMIISGILIQYNILSAVDIYAFNVVNSNLN